MSTPESAGPFSIAAFDVDGTLTDASGAMNTEALELIANLDHRGVVVTIATARGPSGLATIAAALGGKVWAVAYQGALVGSFVGARWATHTETTLEIDLAHEIADLAAESGLATSWHAGTSWFATSLTNEILLESRIVDDAPRVVDDHRRLTAPPHKLMLISRMDETWRLAELRARLPPSVYHSYSHPNYLEVSPPEVDKGRGLTDLLRLISGRAADLAVFGDGENDLAMFGIAGHSVAMAHAPTSVRLAATTVASHGLVAAVRGIRWREFVAANPGT